MLNKRRILISLSIFISVYLFLILPVFGGSETYADFYRKQGAYWFTNFGSTGYLAFEAHEDNGTDDTRIYQTNKLLADANGDMKDTSFNLSTRILGYLPIALLVSLFVATPIKWWKRGVYLAIGFLILHIFLMFFLYILILEKYISTPWLNMYQSLGTTTKNLVGYLNNSINHGIGLNNFLVVIIWISLLFTFEKDIISVFKLENKG